MLMIANDPLFVLPLPSDHRFPILKYELIPAQLVHEGLVGLDNFFRPAKCSLQDVLLTHDENYIFRMLNLQLTEKEMRKIGFPLTKTLVDREFSIVGGTIQCCAYAAKYGVAMHVAGGTHHANAGSGEGFCLLNDVAVAANVLLATKQAEQILIIDLDVHQGQGTAKLFEENPNVFTFSMHGKNNYPPHKEKSDLDIGLEDGASGSAYLKILSEALDEILFKFKPDFAFYISGVDVLTGDRYGKISVSIDECMQRDLLVFKYLKERHIPVVTTAGGGYSRDIKTIVEAHVNTYRAAINTYKM